MSGISEYKGKVIKISGVPNHRQKEFFDSRARFTAYGGARGGGKSWALRRKLVAMCLKYSGIRCLIIRRSYAELRSNHLTPFMREYGEIFTYNALEKAIGFENGSKIFLGYLACDRDLLRYQGQEYDVIAIDEATQISEHQFMTLKATLRGVEAFPRRMYLTCNPGGIGHAWVKRLFIDRRFKEAEKPEDYVFIPARVFDNDVLCRADPEYVKSLESLPEKMREAWLYGNWNVFEGQFFPEFDTCLHICSKSAIPNYAKRFVAFDYGLDMLAVLLIAVDGKGCLYVEREYCKEGLTLSQAAEKVAELCCGNNVEYAVASPDLWNRRQDSGKSGFEIMQSVNFMPPMIAADDRRIAGWRMLREYLAGGNSERQLRISSECRELIRCIQALIFSSSRPEDAASEPHSITHAPEALRYAVMSRMLPPTIESEGGKFIFSRSEKRSTSFFD